MADGSSGGGIVVYWYCLLISVVFFFVTLYYLKKRKIEFGFGLIWFGISVFLFVIALKPAFLETLANWAGIDYKPSFLFACGIFFCLAVCYYLTIKVSGQRKKIIVLTQELSILKNCMEVRSLASADCEGTEKDKGGLESQEGRL